MSRKLIFLPYAYDPQKRTGVNMEASNNAFHEYCMNFCVALVSLKKENPDADVALVTNTDIPQEYRTVLERHGIEIRKVPFDRFLFDDSYTWSLAFYKLCALRAMLQEDRYEYYCYMDTDVVANGSLAPLFAECDHHVMLYDIDHGLQVRDYRIFLEEVDAFLGAPSMITHYGGELFAANRENAGRFLIACEDIYAQMVKRGFRTTRGDEFIISLAAERMKESVKNAGAYIYRFWTGSFRLVSTCYEFNSVALLHFPDEKRSGIPRLYQRYIVKGKYPSSETIYRVCHLRSRGFVGGCKARLRRLLRR